MAYQNFTRLVLCLQTNSPNKVTGTTLPNDDNERVGSFLADW